MGLNAPSNSNGPRVIPPAGMHIARCYAIIDLGTQNTSWQGQPKQVPQVQFSFELPSQLHVFDQNKGPQPMSVHQTYTLSSGDRAKLPKVLKTWGKMTKDPVITADFIKVYLGKFCTITVEHRPSTKNPNEVYANIAMGGAAIGPKMEGVPIPTYPQNPTILFNLDEFSWETFNKLPKFMQEKIQASLEWSGIVAKHGVNPGAVQQNTNNQPAISQHQMPEEQNGIVMGGSDERPAF